MGPGFDVFAIALESPRIEVKFTATLDGSRRIIAEGIHAAEINTDPNLNAAGKALSVLTHQFGKPDGYVLRIKADIPPRKGLGLSGAEAVAAVLCSARHFNLGLNRLDVVKAAAEAEPSHHMDNVSASALGGFNIVNKDPMTENGLIVTLPPPKDLGLAVLVPHIEKSSTEATRQLIPSQIQIAEHIRSTAYAARISAAFAQGNVSGIIEALPWDGIVEPARAEGGAYGRGIDSSFLLEEKKILLDKFRVAETISGAGPSRVLWYSLSEDVKQRRKDKMGTIQPAIALVTDRLKSLGHEVQKVFTTKPSSNGAAIV
jgi:homoserine kinase